MENFSSRLIQLRKSCSMTQKQLAEAIGASVRGIQFYEASQRSPELDALINIANLFNISIDYLVGLTDDPTRPPPPQSKGE